MEYTINTTAAHYEDAFSVRPFGAVKQAVRESIAYVENQDGSLDSIEFADGSVFILPAGNKFYA